LIQLDKDFKVELSKMNKKKQKIANNKIKEIFNYKNFINKNKKKYDAYDLAKKLDVRVCLYCNRQYTLTVKTGNRKEEHITRPEFDHFFDKDTHPLLAMSIFNLIPSCSICNSTLKGTTKFNLKDYIHPYLDNYISNYRYTYKPYNVTSILGGNSDLAIKLVFTKKTPAINVKISNSAKIFELENIFSNHSEELKDLFEIRYKLSSSYLEQLFTTYKSTGISYEDVYRIALGTHYDEPDFIKRPFSKLKKDLLKELGVI
jgi:5-methylcytosine-specific restriction endonuclease McrA